MWLTLLSCDRCHGCFEEERSGLLEIKALINPNSFFGHLGDWTASKELDIADCCEWYGIKCDNTTRRVIQLSLAGARDFRPGDWVLNASLFLPFKELQGLNLSRNRLTGCFENEGFQLHPMRLRKLENLDLSRNQLNSNISSILSGLLSLKSLDLSYNSMLTASVIQDKDVAEFIFTTLNFTAYLAAVSFQLDTSGLRKLEVLSMNELNITGTTLLQSLGTLPSLKTLSLKDTNLSGTSIIQ
ncbi:hypothetical protein OIU84_006898, partial [Salix udensis]